MRAGRIRRSRPSTDAPAEEALIQLSRMRVAAMFGDFMFRPQSIVGANTYKSALCLSRPTHEMTSFPSAPF